MKKIVIKAVSILLCLGVAISCFSVFASAEKITYLKGANDISSAYKDSKYYKNLTQIELTGDGVTDTLAVALSQLEYVEGTSSSGFSGTQGGGGNYTEYCRNYGEGSSYAWCAAYVSFCLFQSRANTSTSKQTIWRDIYCPRWYQNMKNAGHAHDAGSNYTPKSGDLVFFTGGGHIGIVRYFKDGRVYTIEGNTSNSSGLNPEGGGVYCKSYERSYGKFLGFGTPPYKTNDKAIKVDYSGANPSTGLWISDTVKYLYSDTSLNDNKKLADIPKGTIFEVKKILSKACYQVSYNGKTGYIKAAGGSPIYQVTANAAPTTVPETIQKETSAPKETVTANKYAVTEAIKSVKEHIGSGLDKISINGVKVTETETYLLNAGQKIGVSGFAGFSSAIKEFGYYFDGNAQGAVWGSSPKTADSNAKKKAGDKAKLFDIGADTSALTGGAHTVTYVVKFTNNKTCELITLNLDIVGGGEASSESGSGSETSAANGGGGCNGAISLAVALPVALLGGALLVKKKRYEDS